MIKFITNYPMVIPWKTKSSMFSSYVWAKDLKAARALCRKRGLKERIIGQARKAKASVPFPGHAHFTHWICFLGFVALKSGRSPEEVFGDAGVLHELVHHSIGASMMDDPEGDYIKLCKELGFLPNDYNRA